MRAVGIAAFGGRDRLETLELPEPVPGPGEVAIRVAAAGVNPVDVKIREGRLQGRLPHRFPVVLGWDVAGVVDRAGPGVRLRPGEAVWAYARKPEVHGGTYAEVVVLPEASVARKPRSLDGVAAAAVPLAALTALQALDALAVGRGETVLVDAAAGGVGHFAVQVARDRGARVIGVAGPRNHDWLRALGAEEVVEHAGDLAAAVRALRPRGLDAVLALHGGDAQARMAGLLRDGGRLVGIVEPPEGRAFAERGIRAGYVFVAPSAAQLDVLGRMVDEGRLRPHVDDVFALARAAAAHERIEGGHVRGKLVLDVARAR